MKYYLFIFICFLWLNFIYLNRAVYITPYNIGFWQHEFLNTQIVKGDKAKRWYSDTEIYAITGYKYIRGENPTQIHPEVPPAGKLLIGGSIILFGNENLGNLILGFASLVLIYLLGRHMFSGHSPAALLAVLLTSLDPGFRASLTTANIDIPQLLFLLFSLWAFLKAQDNPFWFGFSSFGLGLMMATKFYATAGVLFAVYCVFLLIKGRFKPFIYFFISLPASNTIIAKTSVMSATLDPNNIPRPKEGIPSRAEVTAINVSGRIEITATIIKPTVYFESR